MKKSITKHPNQPLDKWLRQLATFAEKKQISPDYYGTGENLNNFERQIADELGFEAASFFPSGVMAQLNALLVWNESHSHKRFAAHATSHLLLHEEDSYRHLLGFEAIELGDIGSVPLKVDIEQITGKLSCLFYELPMRHLGGNAPEYDQWREIVEYCQLQKIPLHVDGARLFELSPYYERSPQEIVRGVDSLFLSFYKGFGSTSGSLLLGSQDFIDRANIWKRRFGGNLYQIHMLSTPAQMSFEQHKDRFPLYHQKAIEISLALKDLGFSTIPEAPKSNMFHLYLPLSFEQFEKALAENNEWEIKVGVWEKLENKIRVEFSVGEASLDYTGQEIAEVLVKLTKN